MIVPCIAMLFTKVRMPHPLVLVRAGLWLLKRGVGLHS